MNPIQFMKRWKEGMSKITVAQQLHAKIAGLYGNILGMVCGVFTMIIYVVLSKDYKWWWTALILAASTYLNYLELVSTKQQYEQACEIQNMLNNARG